MNAPSPVIVEAAPSHTMRRVVREGTPLQRALAAALMFFALFLGVFVLATAGFGTLPAYLQRIVFVCGIVSIGLLARSAAGTPWQRRGVLLLLPDLAAIAVLVAGLVYVLLDYESFALRIGFPDPTDLAFGLVYLIATLEVTRRVLGLPILVIVAFFILQALFGESFPSMLNAPNVRWQTLVEILFMQDQGLFGSTTDVAATYLMLFLLFGAILTKSNAVQFFQDFSLALMGRRPGGPAHVAVLSSSLLGTASGSVVGNVAGTGSFTIPLMKRTGMKPEFAGAVEAVASSGGQIMPPVMGSAAFLMAGFLGTSYWSIVVAALIPALLYYLGVFAQVELRARKAALAPLVATLPTLRQALGSGGHLLLGILALVVPFFFGASPQRAGLIGVVTLFVLVMLRRHTRLDPRRTLEAIVDAFAENVAVGAAVAAAGVLMGTIWVSGAGNLLADLVLRASGETLPIALVLTAIVALILGMGLPTPAVYLTVALLIVPGLVRLGADVLASHMFAFYFGILANVTPPVALAAYAAASLAGADLNRTGWAALKLAIAGFIVPFMFVYHTGLLMKGPWYEWVPVTVTAAVGVVCLAAVIEGWYRRPLDLLRRAVLLAAAILLILPDLWASAVGIVLALAVAVPLHFKPVRTAASGAADV